MQSKRRVRAGELLEEFSLADAALAPPLTASMKLLSVLPDKRYPLIAAWSAAQRVRSRFSLMVSPHQLLGAV